MNYVLAYPLRGTRTAGWWPLLWMLYLGPNIISRSYNPVTTPTELPWLSVAGIVNDDHFQTARYTTLS
jgi:hypothetical protein